MTPLIVWIIGTALIALMFVGVVYFAFWITGKMNWPPPGDLILRGAVGIIALLVLFWFVVEHGLPPGIK